MLVRLIAVGKGMPAWVAAGFNEYAGRLPTDCRLELVEVTAQRRGKRQDTTRAMHEECTRLRAAVPKGAWTIALDEGGRPWSTRQLAAELARWRQEESHVALLVGGSDGLDPDCRKQARQVWSLSSLTLPHMLVRVMIAEQIYRAWTVVAGHPYHRD
ncbi:MAG: 23S rRNA (pseudouridine(1915)-N(3))-methyltransferase RlmH [Gammaproteobacteria bacterium]|nr:23S rRNA (pseudouridine(1915)-N(3))-methyltransferase RlmH [Gammaproteobacteria bacterium]